MSQGWEEDGQRANGNDNRMGKMSGSQEGWEEEGQR